MFYINIILFFVGVAVRSVFPFGSSFVVFLFVVSVFIFLYFLYLRASSVIAHNSILIILSLVFLSLGMVRTDYVLSSLNPLAIKNLVNNTVLIRGVIQNDPIKGEKYTLLNLKIIECDRMEILDQIVKIKLSPNFNANVGDEISLSGDLSVSGDYGENSIARIGTSLAEGIVFEINFPEVKEHRERIDYKWRRVISDFKQAFIQKVENVISFPYSTLGLGMTIAGSGSLPVELKNNFINAGLIHIVVLSGYNVAIVAEFLGRVAWFLPRLFSFSLGVIGIIVFILLAGATAPLIRAGIMASIVLLARFFGRPYEATRALFLACGIMVYINPNLLLFDLSFQLSLLATLGVIEFTPIISMQLAHKFGKSFGELIATTLSAQIAVAPLLLFSLSKISLVGIFTNILVVPFVPFAMFLTILVGFTGFIMAPLSMIASLPAQGILFYIVTVAEEFSDLSFALVNLNIGLKTTIFLYIALVLLWNYFKSMDKLF